MKRLSVILLGGLLLLTSCGPKRIEETPTSEGTTVQMTTETVETSVSVTTEPSTTVAPTTEVPTTTPAWVTLPPTEAKMTLPVPGGGGDVSFPKEPSGTTHWNEFWFSKDPIDQSEDKAQRPELPKGESLDLPPGVAPADGILGQLETVDVSDYSALKALLEVKTPRVLRLSDLDLVNYKEPQNNQTVIECPMTFISTQQRSTENGHYVIPHEEGLYLLQPVEGKIVSYKLLSNLGELKFEFPSYERFEPSKWVPGMYEAPGYVLYQWKSDLLSEYLENHPEARLVLHLSFFEPES